jgi:radical SAM superfamily enzyme YgiQ (UPF0313 family)
MVTDSGNGCCCTDFEQGPIRPPSEAESLLLRVTRNCPWNRCAFCPVYGGTTYSVRLVEEVISDVDAVHDQVKRIEETLNGGGSFDRGAVRALDRKTPEKDKDAFRAALHWVLHGGKESIFLQDANALAMKPNELKLVIEHIRERFPETRRITCYSRSSTLARMKPEKLTALAEAGLSRIHVGLESGCDEVLEFMDKGVTAERQVEAGLKVKAAGIELSEYYMPGLGGRKWWREHAVRTAEAMNRIDPDFIRLRTLAIPGHVRLAEDVAEGRFEKLDEVGVIREIKTFIEHLGDISSTVKSDHFLNLLGDLEGKLPDDKPAMLKLTDDFLDLDPESRALFQFGRRLGMLARIEDLRDNGARSAVQAQANRHGITPETVDRFIDRAMRRFV